MEGLTIYASDIFKSHFAEKKFKVPILRSMYLSHKTNDTQPE